MGLKSIICDIVHHACRTRPHNFKFGVVNSLNLGIGVIIAFEDFDLR